MNEFWRSAGNLCRICVKKHNIWSLLLEENNQEVFYSSYTADDLHFFIH